MLFLMCGGVSTCIPPFRHTSYKPLRKDIIEMSVSCTIDNINRVAKFPITPYLTCTVGRCNFPMGGQMVMLPLCKPPRMGIGFGKETI